MRLSPGARSGPTRSGASWFRRHGEVYCAHDARLGRDVAIKVLPESVSSDRERLRRFEREARAAAALNHPSILAVYDVGSHEGSPYLVSELLEGETLRQRCARAPSRRRRRSKWLDPSPGPGRCHEKGIVHRDVKPEERVPDP